ncbi:hypothetical protein C8046_05935 [Serinibacter arcticus]|uniref:Uncharacterized protein n=1 Tax=Serinibacter arcticus TaxID=1655435 RepID=A0A2U1ZTF4_9MICO|nr:hypothetical protein [Serinibacter arcticus]PWD50269.1 hypothetical protein C8046_05935 [Serinibacter arcticus]
MTHEQPRVPANPDRRPVSLVVATAVLALQALVFLALTVAVLTDALEVGEAAAGLAIGVFTLVVAAGATLVAVGLWRRRRWARGPAVAWSVLVVLVGASQLSVNALVAIAVVLVGLVGAVSAAAPSTREALAGVNDPNGPDAV